jgi:hypothetical protein
VGTPQALASLPGIPYAATILGCRLGGLALLVGLGSVALFSRQIAGAIWQRPDLITERKRPSAERRESRRLYATVGRWMLFAWGALGAGGGLLVLVGILHCG